MVPFRCQIWARSRAMRARSGPTPEFITRRRTSGNETTFRPRLVLGSRRLPQLRRLATPSPSSDTRCEDFAGPRMARIRVSYAEPD